MAKRATAATKSPTKVKMGRGEKASRRTTRSAKSRQPDESGGNVPTPGNTINEAAADIGSTLGHLVGRVDAWTKQRGELAGELQKFVKTAHGMLADLGGISGTRDVRRKRGRAKASAMPEETKATLQASARKRQREGHTVVGTPVDVRSTIRATDGRRFSARQSGKG